MEVTISPWNDIALPYIARVKAVMVEVQHLRMSCDEGADRVMQLVDAAVMDALVEESELGNA